MGFFSWKCAKCDKSVMNQHSCRPSDSDCILILPEKIIHEPAYDGYGVFDEIDVLQLPEDIQVKLLHTRCFEDDKYQSLPESKTCDMQGYWCDNPKCCPESEE